MSPENATPEELINYEAPVTAKELFEASNHQLEHEFGILYRCTSTRQHEKMEYNPKSIRQYNRYTDILTYEHSRVVLKSSEEDSEDDYINACFVDVSFFLGFNQLFFRVHWAQTIRL